MNILIIGGGIAAQSVVEAIRERDAEVDLTMVCEEPRLPWDRVSLSHLLIDGEVDELQLRPAAWYEDHGVTVMIGRRVVFLDTARSLARLDDDTELTYDRCVLATGSDALMPPIPGIDQKGVAAFRSPEDCVTIQAAADAGRPAAVIGGGLLGLEAARGIASRGAPVTVVHLMDRLMERQLDANAAALLAPAMEELDVKVLLGKSTETILGNDDGQVTGLRFTDGEVLDAELVVVAIGSSRVRNSRSLPACRWAAASSSTTLCARAPRTCSPWVSAPSTAAWSTASSPRSTTRRRSPPTRSSGLRIRGTSARS